MTDATTFMIDATIFMNFVTKCSKISENQVLIDGTTLYAIDIVNILKSTPELEVFLNELSIARSDTWNKLIKNNLNLLNSNSNTNVIKYQTGPLVVTPSNLNIGCNFTNNKFTNADDFHKFLDANKELPLVLCGALEYIDSEIGYNFTGYIDNLGQLVPKL